MRLNGETKLIGGIAVLTVVILVGGVFFLSRGGSSSIPKDQVIAQNGLHWHPKLTITIKGKKQEIPANIGIGAVHQPMHTHDASGTIHMEMQGVISKDDTRIGNFFRIWGKEFNLSCIFDKCNSKEGNVRSVVNGKENKEFENYKMHDGDNIEIRYD